MSDLLRVAALPAGGVGLAHSILGERHLLIRLFRRLDLPKLFGGTAFSTRTLRVAWHSTTVAWWGFAALIWLIAQGAASDRNILLAVGATFVVTGILTLVVSRARHRAWAVFFAIGGLTPHVAAS